MEVDYYLYEQNLRQQIFRFNNEKNMKKNKKNFYTAIFVNLFSKVIVIVKVLGYIAIFSVSLMGVITITNIKLEINISTKLFISSVVILIILTIIYSMVYTRYRKGITKWEIVTKSLEDQITKEVTDQKANMRGPVSDILPRDARINFTLARTFLSEIRTTPFLKLALGVRKSKPNLKINFEKPLRISLVNPGMHKTYLISKIHV